MKSVLCWILAAVLPMIFLAFFGRYLVRQWALMESYDIPLCKDFHFPDFGSDPNESMRLLLAGKAYIWYPIFVVSSILFLLSREVGRIVLYISNVFLCVLLFGQFYTLTRAKSALRGIKKPIDRSFYPIVRMFRVSFVYLVILFTIYNLFFDFVMLE